MSCFLPEFRLVLKTGQESDRLHPVIGYNFPMTHESSTILQKKFVTACRYIEEAEDLPTLLNVAEHVQLSPACFQKIFTKALGVSPGHYADAMRFDSIGHDVQLFSSRPSHWPAHGREGCCPCVRYQSGCAGDPLSSHCSQVRRCGRVSLESGPKGAIVEIKLERRHACKGK